MLKDLRRQIGKKNNVPPYVVFQDFSLEDMATQYPISMEDMTKITGVSLGKAQRYAKPFIEMIEKYVEENEVERPTDFVVKQVADKSKTKVEIIRLIDKKLALADIARQNGFTWDEFMEELYSIVNSGTKVNINYAIEDLVDESVRDDIYDYFRTALNDSEEEAYHILKEDDIQLEEVQLMRIKFISEMAN